MAYIRKTNRQRKQTQFYNPTTQLYEGILTTGELYDRVAKLHSLTAKALISVLYLSGARISEVVKSLQVNQLREATREDGEEFMYFVDLKVKKKRDAMNLRTVPVPKEKYLGWIKWIYAYVRQNDLKPGSILFNFSDRNALYHINNSIGFNCHRLRHTRATNLSREDSFNESKLRTFFNHSKGTKVDVYTHHNTRDIEDALL